MGWQIVRHSFILLFRNFGNALKVSVGPVLLFLMLGLLVLKVMGLTMQQVIWDTTMGIPTPSVILFVLLALVALIFTSAWIAVAWHRFILLEDYPAFLPAIVNRPIWAYAGRSFILGIVMILAVIPAAIVAGILAQIFGATSTPTLLAVGFALGVYFSYIWLRIALVLPATAVGTSMRLGESWKSTSPLSSAILGASAILVALNIAASSLLGALTGGGVVMAVDVAVNWITLMVGTSILTTLYGHVVEGRSLT